MKQIFHRGNGRTWICAGAAFSFLVVCLFGQGYLSPLESNKKVVFDFYRLVVEPRNADLVELYVSPDFVDHDPAEQKGPDSITKMLKAMGPAASDDIISTLRNPPAYIMAEGDLVTWLFQQSMPDPKTSPRWSSVSV
jgi:predicted SnoaL-like aldol condensation-catalyzing enzyme